MSPCKRRQFIAATSDGAVPGRQATSPVGGIKYLGGSRDTSAYSGPTGKSSMKRIGFGLLVAASLAAQNQNPPYKTLPDVDVNTDLVYASIGSREMHLDLYRPKNPAGLTPAVVYIHGGGFSGGNRGAFRRQAAYMATKGYAGACIEYRLSGEAAYPAALYDAKAAVRWLRANASQYGIDPGRIAAAGGSAGGYLAAMLGTTIGDPAFEGNEGSTAVSSRVAAVAAFNPALDFVDLTTRKPDSSDASLEKFLGAAYKVNPGLYKEVSPTGHVSAKSAPFLFLHGDSDKTVPYQESLAMQHKLKEAGVRAEIFTATGADHGFFNAPPWYEPALQRMEAFFTSVLAEGSSSK